MKAKASGGGSILTSPWPQAYAATFSMRVVNTCKVPAMRPSYCEAEPRACWNSISIPSREKYPSCAAIQIGKAPDEWGKFAMIFDIGIRDSRDRAKSGRSPDEAE